MAFCHLKFGEDPEACLRCAPAYCADVPLGLVVGGYICHCQACTPLDVQPPHACSQTAVCLECPTEGRSRTAVSGSGLFLACQLHLPAKAGVLPSCLPSSCRCIDALRQLETPEGWSQPAVALLALQAFLATGNAQQAEVEAAGEI